MAATKESAVDALCINAWSGPRCLSTSLMYSFAQRSDTEVLDEPLYGHYLKLTGAPRPYRELVLSEMEQDGRTVVERILTPRAEGRVLYAKHMAKQRIGCGQPLMHGAAHVLLVRDPRSLIPSFDEVTPCTLEATCLPELCCVFSELRSMGRTPPVVLSEDLQRNPEGTLRALCAALGLAWEPVMLSWEAGPRPEDGVWAPWWYHRTHQSTGFAAPDEAKPERTLTPAQLDLLEDCTPLYTLLQRHALTPLANPPVALPSLAERGAFPAVGFSQKDGAMTGAHLHIPDQRNRRTLVGIRDGVSGRFSIVPRAEAKVSVYDSGFILGDGMWEGLRLHRGVLNFVEAHVDRLFENLKAVDMPLGLTKPELIRMIRRTVEANGMTTAVHVRLMVTRGLKKTPYQNPLLTVGHPTVAIIAEHKAEVSNPPPITLFTCHVRRGPPDVQDPAWNSHCKLNCIAACIQANKVGADEALMLDPQGFVATCNSVNFFCVRGSEVWSPTAKYQMAGITRGHVLQLCRNHHIPVKELDFSLTQVYGADEVFVTGTFGGLTPVREVDGRIIGDGCRGPMCERLQRLYADLIQQDVARQTSAH